MCSSSVFISIMCTFFSSCYCKVSFRLADCLPDTICQASVKFYTVAAAACIDLEGQQVTDPAVGYTSIVSARLLSALSVYRRRFTAGKRVRRQNKSKNMRKKRQNNFCAGDCKSKPGDREIGFILLYFREISR